MGISGQGLKHSEKISLGIQSEYGKNADQNNSEYGHFSGSV